MSRPGLVAERSVTGGPERVKDPVCGMDVDPERVAGESEYEGRTYYFCSPGCKRRFDEDPRRYVGQEPGQQG
ncbi:YHS domain-containing protein [Tautonia sociabilis]|uniref:YHS domain-containing protein n=1 Tax=Tautonia sociabilis TaxID=2080755 RepID=A0A432MKP7_9BACT|nr:YHS domain-containing protein [Tautonia sociabilis]RUL87981.1 YHS domain-containing protein [Tautonia sociabilis]